MIKDRKPLGTTSTTMNKNQGGRRVRRKNGRNDQGCCEELDYFFVCCIKLCAFVEVILFALIFGAVVIYIVLTSSTDKLIQRSEYANEFTGPDAWYVRTYYKNDNCNSTLKSPTSNGYRLGYCMPLYGTSEKIVFKLSNDTSAKYILVHTVYEGDYCNGIVQSITEYNTYLNVKDKNAFGACNKVVASTGNINDAILRPPKLVTPGAIFFKDILLSSTNGADPRNPTTKELPIAVLNAQEIIAPPDILESTEEEFDKNVGLGKMGNGDCFVQAMEKLNHGIFVTQEDLTNCIEKDGNVKLSCLGKSDDVDGPYELGSGELGSYEVPSRKIDGITNTLVYDDASLCINEGNQWSYLWAFNTALPTYENKLESTWVRTFFVGVGIVIASLVGLNTLQEVYFMFTQKDYKVEF